MSLDAGWLWKVLSCIGFASINGVIKGLSLPGSQIASIENLLGALLLWPFCRRNFFSCRFLMQEPFFWIRSLCALLGTLCWVHSLQQLPLLQIIAMGFLSPFVTTLGAYFFLGESFHWKRALAIIFAVAGGILVTYGHVSIYGPGTSSLLVMTPLVANILFALVNLMSKSMVARVPPLFLTFFLLVTTGTGLLFTLPTWHWPSINEGVILLGLGSLTALAHLCLHQAMKHTEILTLIPLGAIRLLVSAFIGWMFFHEVPTLWTGCGTLAIGVGVIMLARIR